MNDITSLYSQSQQGGELPYFIGKQYGLGGLRNLGRLAFPILKRLGHAALNTVKDVFVNKKEFFPSMKSNAMDYVVNPTIDSMINKHQKRKSKNDINKRSKKRSRTIF